MTKLLQQPLFCFWLTGLMLKAAKVAISQAKCQIMQAVIIPETLTAT